MLTAGADAVAGTSGNDTITALTIKADGSAATTLSAFDTIDGAAGNDTLNIYNDNTNNTALPTSATVKNVETINIYNDGGAFNTGTANLIDASKFAGATTINQVNVAGDVINVASGATAKFTNVDISGEVMVGVATGVASVNVAVDGVGDGDVGSDQWIQVGGDALNAVNVTGTLGAKEVSINLDVFAGKNQQTVALNTSVAVGTLYVYDDGYGAQSYGPSNATVGGNGGTKVVTTLDASASTGDIGFDGLSYGSSNVGLVTIKTGSGDDTLSLVTATLKDDATTTADETVSALVQSGAGNDDITVNTTGTGTTTVNGDAGDDTVTLSGKGTGKLTVNLGAGDDTFTGTGSVAATDSVDGGEGSDTLQLKMVGSANIGAFANFENFDVADLNTTLDVDILATKNTVTEIVGSAALGGNSTLTNLGAGVGFRATGDMGTGSTLTLTQKTAGALTVTVDADEATADTAANTHDAAVTATNATSLKAVFASDYADKLADYANSTELTLTGSKATSLTVESNGTETTNTLNYTSAANGTTGDDLVTSATLSGASKLTFNVTYSGANQESLTNVDASAMTGALVFDLADLKASTDTTFAGGVVKLGSGDDVITGATMTSVSGIEKGTAENSTLQSNYDVINIANAVQAGDIAATATITVKDGLLTFNGNGPQTLDDAIALAATAANDANEAVVFQYIGNSYIYAQGGDNTVSTDDVVIKLAGVTGLTGLDDVGAAGTSLYVF